MWKILILLFFVSCKEMAEVKDKSIVPDSALNYLRQAKDILRQEEGQLMIQGRAFSEKEKMRYETLLEIGKKLDSMIDQLERTQL